VLRAATALSAQYPQVHAWWYAPRPPQTSKRPHDADDAAIEVVVEPSANAELDCARLASALARELDEHPVRVRVHGGHEVGLFRLLSRQPLGS
jgi:hypothetical protein